MEIFRGGEKISNLKIIKIGNSYGITIPTEILKKHKLEVGDEINIKFSYNKLVLDGGLAKSFEEVIKLYDLEDFDRNLVFEYFGYAMKLPVKEDFKIYLKKAGLSEERIQKILDLEKYVQEKILIHTPDFNITDIPKLLERKVFSAFDKSLVQTYLLTLYTFVQEYKINKLPYGKLKFFEYLKKIGLEK